jgi:hypothetical protein
LKTMVTLVTTDLDHATQQSLPASLNIRRHHVHCTLLWLKANNDIYANCVISEDRLATLPMDGTPVHTANDIGTIPSHAFQGTSKLPSSAHSLSKLCVTDLHLSNRVASMKPAAASSHIESMLLLLFPIIH